MLRPYKAKRLIWDDLALFLDLVECAMGVPMASVLISLGGLMTEEWSSKRCLLYLGIALLFSLGMHWWSLFQLNFVDLHIIGATNSLLSTLDEAVLFWIVGAAWISAASTVILVFLQSEWKTCVGFLRSIR